MKNVLLLLILLLSVSCSRERDQFSDSFSVSSKEIKRSRIECYSGGEVFFSHESTKRVWANNGKFEVVEKDRLITIDGDCILFEYFI